MISANAASETCVSAALPSAVGRTRQADAERVGKHLAADFDRAFMKHMLSEHKDAVSMFETAARPASASEVKDFASRTLPMLQDHLQQARSIYELVSNNRLVAMAPGASR